MNFGIFRFVQGIVKLRGGTDNTVIGNISDSLKVTGPHTNSKLRYVDMNASSGGVARDTVITNATWVTVFQYSGSGSAFCFRTTLESYTGWLVRFLVDGEEVFPSAGLLTDDLQDNAAYDLDNKGAIDASVGITKNEHDSFTWMSPLGFPAQYLTSVEVRVKRNTGAATKKFKAGLMILSKQT